jgi:hypothetical protein
MKQLIVIAALFVSLSLKAQVTVKDFEPAFGTMKGTLTYLDYTSGKPFTMPAIIILSAGTSGSGTIIRSLSYPEEPKANGTDTIIISAGGTMIDDEKLVSRSVNAAQTEIITERDGIDGNDRRKAKIRHIYSISNTVFRIRKEVRFEGTDQWIQRNEYRFSR